MRLDAGDKMSTLRVNGLLVLVLALLLSEEENVVIWWIHNILDQLKVQGPIFQNLVLYFIWRITTPKM